MQVVSRAASILRALDGEHRGLSLSELGERTGLPRSTVHRLVTALGVEGFVVGAPATGRTRLGPELTRLALHSRGELQAELRPYLEDLRRTLDETIGLSVLEPQGVRFVDQITANHPLQAITAVGELLPAWSSASGRALLATLPTEQREAMVPRRLVAHVPSTTTDRREVMAAIEQRGARRRRGDPRGVHRGHLRGGRRRPRRLRSRGRHLGVRADRALHPPQRRDHRRAARRPRARRPPSDLRGPRCDSST